jgi:hypothetical protein
VVAREEDGVLRYSKLSGHAATLNKSAAWPVQKIGAKVRLVVSHKRSFVSDV